jgi:hypothetical protein
MLHETRVSFGWHGSLAATSRIMPLPPLMHAVSEGSAAPTGVAASTVANPMAMEDAAHMRPTDVTMNCLRECAL